MACPAEMLQHAVDLISSQAPSDAGTNPQAQPQPRRVICMGANHNRKRVPLPLMEDNYGKRVTSCLAHRVHAIMKNRWRRWADGKGAAVNWSQDDFAAWVWTQGMGHVEAWKKSAIKHHGSAECLSAEAEKAIIDMLAWSHPSNVQLAKRQEYEKSKGARSSGTRQNSSESS